MEAQTGSYEPQNIPGPMIAEKEEHKWNYDILPLLSFAGFCDLQTL